MSFYDQEAETPTRLFRSRPELSLDTSEVETGWIGIVMRSEIEDKLASLTDRHYSKDEIQNILLDLRATAQSLI